MHGTAQRRLDLPHVPPGDAPQDNAHHSRRLWRAVPLAQLGWSQPRQGGRAPDRWSTHRQALRTVAPHLERAHAGGWQAGWLCQDGWQRPAAHQPHHPGW